MLKDATTGKLYSSVVNQAIADLFSGTAADHVLAWNLGLIEFLYLIPVNLVVLWLAFRPSKRLPAGFITVLAGVLYAPVRFFLDFLRPSETDPPLLGLTFAQWSSILAFGVALYAGRRIFATGVAAEPVTRTSREAQERLKIILREDEESQHRQTTDSKAETERKKAEAERKKAELAKVRAERDREDAQLAEAERAKAAQASKDPTAAADDDSAEAGERAVEADAAVEARPGEAEAEPAAGTASKPAGGKPGSGKPGAGRSTGAKKNKSRQR